MAKKITQYPASAGSPNVLSLIDISEFDGSLYTSKKLTIDQLILFLNDNLDLGSSFTFKNNTGAYISKGMAVELSGAVGLDLPEIQLLSSSFSNVGLSQIFIANEDILNGNSGNFIESGFLNNFGTVGLTVGQKIFWDVPSQSLTVVGTDIDQVFVGIVTVVDANGQLFVSPTRGIKTLTSQLINDGADSINPFITALDVPAAPTLTSELTNDGENGLNPFITALDIPTVPTLTSDLTNDGANGLNPFITALDIPTFASADKMVTVGRNSTGSTLYKGTIVYILGSTGNRPNFVKARADIEATSAGTFGVIESNILNNADGNCVTIGTIGNLDTRAVATNPFTVDTLVDGDTIYLSPTTAGYITNVKPSAPNHLVYIGKVVRTSPTLGTIVYRIQNGYELEELHNVAISGSLLNGDILQYESATQLWKNKVLSVPVDVLGISDAAGVYTYYSTLTLAMAAAVSGQTITFFTDITETSNIEIILKNGVDINFNGYTYTLNTSGIANCFLTNIGFGRTRFYNGKIQRIGGTQSALNSCVIMVSNVASTVYNLDFNGVEIYSSFGVGISGTSNTVPKINGVKLRTFSHGCYFGTGVQIDNSFIETFGVGDGCFTSIMTNCYVVTTGGGNGVTFPYSGRISNSYISISGTGSGRAISCVSGTTITNCTAISTRNMAIYNFGATSICTYAYSTAGNAFEAGSSTRGTAINSYGYTTAGVAFFYLNEITNCYGESTSSAAVDCFPSGNIYNSVFKSSASVVGQRFNRSIGSTFICTFNNVNGHAINPYAQAFIANNTLIVTNNGANCIYAASSQLTRYVNNTFIDSTTPINVNIVQQTTNTTDSQGNILM